MEVLGDDDRPPLLPRPHLRLPGRRPLPAWASRAALVTGGVAVVALALRPADGGLTSPTTGPVGGEPSVTRGLLAWPARGPDAGDPGLRAEAQQVLRLWDSGGTLTAVPLWSGGLPDGRRLVVVAADRDRTTVVVMAVATSGPPGAGADRLQLVDVDERDPVDVREVRWQDRERDGSATFTALLPPGASATVTVAALGGAPASAGPVPDTDGLLQVRTGPERRVTRLLVDGEVTGPEGLPVTAPPLPVGLLELGRAGSGERQLRADPDRACAVVVREQTRSDDEEGECLPLGVEPSLRVDAVGTAPAGTARVLVTDARGAADEVVLHPVPGTQWLVWLPPGRLDGQVVRAAAYDRDGRVLGEARGSI